MLILINDNKYLCSDFQNTTENITQAGQFDYIPWDDEIKNFYIVNDSGDFLCQKNGNLLFEKDMNDRIHIQKVLFIYNIDKNLTFQINSNIYSFYLNNNILKFDRNINYTINIDFLETNKSVEDIICSENNDMISDLINQNKNLELEFLKAKEINETTPYGIKTTYYCGGKLSKTIEIIGEYKVEENYDYDKKLTSAITSKGKNKLINIHDKNFNIPIASMILNDQEISYQPPELKSYSISPKEKGVIDMDDAIFHANKEIKNINKWLKDNKTTPIYSIIDLLNRHPQLVNHRFEKSHSNYLGYPIIFYVGKKIDSESILLMEKLISIPNLQVNSRTIDGFRLIDLICGNPSSLDIESTFSVLKLLFTCDDLDISTNHISETPIESLLFRIGKNPDKDSNAYRLAEFIANDSKFLPPPKARIIKKLIDIGIFNNSYNDY